MHLVSYPKKKKKKIDVKNNIKEIPVYVFLKEFCSFKSMFKYLIHFR